MLIVYKLMFNKVYYQSILFQKCMKIFLNTATYFLLFFIFQWFHNWYTVQGLKICTAGNKSMFKWLKKLGLHGVSMYNLGIQRWQSQLIQCTTCISRFDTKNVNNFFSFFIQYDLLEYFSSNYVKYFFQSNKKLFYWILYHILIFWKSNMTLHYMMQTLHLNVLINFSFNFQCLSDKSKYFLFIFMFNEFMIGTLPKNLHRRK